MLNEVFENESDDKNDQMPSNHGKMYCSSQILHSMSVISNVLLMLLILSCYMVCVTYVIQYIFCNTLHILF